MLYFIFLGEYLYENGIYKSILYILHCLFCGDCTLSNEIIFFIFVG